MEIFAAITGSLVAVLLGAWINNVFTWKIKNRIDALDIVYLAILERNQYFLGLCLELKKNPQFQGSLHSDFNTHFHEFNHKIMLNCFIIDGIKGGSLYQQIKQWHDILANVINSQQHEDFNLPPDSKGNKTTKKYKKRLCSLTDEVLYLRNNATSFRYMLKSLLLFNVC